MEATTNSLYQITGVDFYHQIHTLNPKVCEFHCFDEHETNLADIVTEIDYFLTTQSITDFELHTPVFDLEKKLMFFNNHAVSISKNVEYMNYRGFYITNQNNKYYIYIV